MQLSNLSILFMLLFSLPSAAEFEQARYLRGKNSTATTQIDYNIDTQFEFEGLAGSFFSGFVGMSGLIHYLSSGSFSNMLEKDLSFPAAFVSAWGGTAGLIGFLTSVIGTNLYLSDPEAEAIGDLNPHYSSMLISASANGLAMASAVAYCGSKMFRSEKVSHATGIITLASFSLKQVFNAANYWLKKLL